MIKESLTAKEFCSNKKHLYKKTELAKLVKNSLCMDLIRLTMWASIMELTRSHSWMDFSRLDYRQLKTGDQLVSPISSSVTICNFISKKTEILANPPQRKTLSFQLCKQELVKLLHKRKTSLISRPIISTKIQTNLPLSQSKIRNLLDMRQSPMWKEKNWSNRSKKNICKKHILSSGLKNLILCRQMFRRWWSTQKCRLKTLRIKRKCKKIILISKRIKRLSHLQILLMDSSCCHIIQLLRWLK